MSLFCVREKNCECSNRFLGSNLLPIKEVLLSKMVIIGSIFIFGIGRSCELVVAAIRPPIGVTATPPKTPWKLQKIKKPKKNVAKRIERDWEEWRREASRGRAGEWAMLYVSYLIISYTSRFSLNGTNKR